MKKGFGIIFMLTLVVTLASVGVFVVHEITAPIIRDANIAKVQEAVKEVFPDIQGTTWTVEDSTLNFDAPITGAQEIKDGDTLMGIVYTVTFRGFANDFTFVVGVNRTGEVTGYKTLSNNETASSAGEFDEADTFAFLQGTLLEFAGGAFDGVGGATYTSNYWKTAMASVASWHASAGVFPELSQAEKDALLINSILGGGYTVTEYTPQGLKTLADFDLDIVYKAEGNGEEYVIYIEEYESFNEGAKVLLVVDLKTNKTVKFQMLANNDTEGWGEVLLSETDRWAELEGVSQQFLFDGDFDDLGGATTTYAKWQDAMQRISIFHQAEFQNIIRYTTAELMEIYKEQLSVDFTGNRVIDVTEQKLGDLYITNIYDVKDGLDNVLGTVYYVTTFGDFNGGPTFIRFLVGVDTDGNYTGLRVLETTDSKLSGSSLLITDPNVFSSTGYFAKEIEGVAVTTEIDLTDVAGFETQVTNIETALNAVGVYHVEKYPFRDDPVIADANMIPVMDNSSYFETIYSNYAAVNGIVNIYEAYDVNDTLLGYVYAGKYRGNNSDVLYTIGVDLTGKVTTLNVYSGAESWLDAGMSTSFWNSDLVKAFDGLDVSVFVTNYTPNANPNTGGTSTDVDAVSGVSTTSGGDGVHFGLIDSVYKLLKFHSDNSVGGAS